MLIMAHMNYDNVIPTFGSAGQSGGPRRRRLQGARRLGGLLLLALLPIACFHRPPKDSVRVSLNSGGYEADDRAVDPVASGEGEIVAYASLASNLVGNDTNRTWDIFVRDRSTGTTTRVSLATGGGQANGGSVTPSISVDGRFVAFASRATNLYPLDTNRAWDVFVHDRVTGTTERVSVGRGGVVADSASFRPVLSADGRYVAFESLASNLVMGDRNGAWDVFVYDRETRTTERVSVGPRGQEVRGHAFAPSISGDGRYVVFESDAAGYVPRDMNVVGDVFMHDRTTGTTARVSVGTHGEEGRGASANGTMSTDGRYVAFESRAPNLVPGDANGAWDVFVHDLETGHTERMSVDDRGAEAHGNSHKARLNANGRFVVFESAAADLTPGDANDRVDVFVRDRIQGVVVRMSDNPKSAAQGNGHSQDPVISADGAIVVFESLATNLAPRDLNGTWDAFALTNELALHTGTEPEADAGPDQTVECTGPDGTPVVLDGSGSTDPDGVADIVSYEWREGVALLGHGVQLTALLDSGMHVISLTVTDSIGLTDTDFAMVEVVDTTPPVLEVTATPAVLWPPNHKMVEVTPTITASDGCDAAPMVVLADITVNEPDNGTGDGNTTDDIQVDADGRIFLRAERAGNGDDRIYTITYTAVDAAGNATDASVTVTVPHNR